MNRFLVAFLIAVCVMASQHKDDVHSKIEKVIHSHIAVGKVKIRKASPSNNLYADSD
jgi:hypothetical protein